MVICPKCNSLMRHVYRFSPTKNCELDICTKCYFETNPKKIIFNDRKATQNKTEEKKKANKNRKGKKKDVKKRRTKHSKK